MISFQPHLDLVATAILFGAIQCLILATIFFIKGRKSPLIHVAWVMLVISVIESESFLNYSGYIIYLPWMINLSPPLIFLLGPFSLIFTRSVFGQKETRFKFLHFIPALLFFCYSFSFYLQPVDYKLYAVLKDVHHLVMNRVLPDFKIDPLNIRGLIIIEGLAIHLLIYNAIIVFFVYRSSRDAVKKPNSINKAWVIFWAACSMTGGCIFLLTGGVINGYMLYRPLLPSWAVDVFCMIMAYGSTAFWLSKALQNLSGTKYQKSALDVQFQAGKLLLLKQLMSEQKLFMSPDFSLRRLAASANMTPHNVSQVINSGGISFSEFVNQFRVEEARRMLEAPDGDFVKVENLAYALGYKSKSAFFNSFRRLTRMTPAQFRHAAKAR